MVNRVDDVVKFGKHEPRQPSIKAAMSDKELADLRLKVLDRIESMSFAERVLFLISPFNVISKVLEEVTGETYD